MGAVYTTVEKAASAGFEEKRSRFTGHAAPAKTETEAMAFIKSKQQEFRDATHNVWAYYMNNGVLARYSDDGEPQGTAGMPVLEALRKSGADDVCVVVTRYFGGIQLGAGGLVRAYSKAATLAVSAARIVTFERFSELCAVLSYTDYQKVAAELPKFGALTDATDFSDTVSLRFAVREEQAPELCRRISELTSARALISAVGTRFDRSAQQ